MVANRLCIPSKCIIRHLTNITELHKSGKRQRNIWPVALWLQRASFSEA